MFIISGVYAEEGGRANQYGHTVTFDEKCIEYTEECQFCSSYCAYYFPSSTTVTVYHSYQLGLVLKAT